VLPTVVEVGVAIFKMEMSAEGGVMVIVGTTPLPERLVASQSLPVPVSTDDEAASPPTENARLVTLQLSSAYSIFGGIYKIVPVAFAFTLAVIVKVSLTPDQESELVAESGP
jgi:hypothetical protein